MKRFECTVTRTDQYVIELDETVLDENWIKEWREVFYSYNTLEEHAEHLAQFRARFGEQFIEGYGNPLVNGKNPFAVKDDNVNRAINIKVISEDNDCEVEVNDITNKIGMK